VAMIAKMKTEPAALGFRVKSGWAVLILIGGSVRSPRLYQNGIINLSDPRNQEARQPYHAAMGKLETNATRLKGRIHDVRCTTKRSIVDLLAQYMENGYVIRRAALVVGSVIDPYSIANPHIRAHALEGRLFRTTLEASLRSRGIHCSLFTERDAYAVAAKSLGLSTGRIREMLANLGRAATGPWRADQKLAALAAWMALP
jgi:hypothetical protein